MDAATFATAQRALATARREVSPLNRVTDDWQPRDLGEAYRLQAAVAEALGGNAGWKVSAVTPAQRAAAGLDRPVGGMLLRRWLQRDAPGAPARFALADFVAPRLECEFAFELARDLPRRPERAYTREEVGAATAGLALGVEIVDSRLPLGSPTLAQLADAYNNGAYIAGTTSGGGHARDLAGVAITLTVEAADGGTSSNVASGDAQAVLDGDPFAAVVLFANAQPDQGPGLRAGDIVTTGSCTGAPGVPGRGRYRARFVGLGDVCFELF